MLRVEVEEMPPVLSWLIGDGGDVEGTEVKAIAPVEW